MPGLSVPALLDMTRDKNPTTRVYGLLMIKRLQAVMALRALADLQDDTAQVNVADDDTGPAYTTSVLNFATLTPELAIRSAACHRPAEHRDDGTELSMVRVVRETCQPRGLQRSSPCGASRGN